jgi:hypothetical protein
MRGPGRVGPRWSDRVNGTTHRVNHRLTGRHVLVRGFRLGRLSRKPRRQIPQAAIPFTDVYVSFIEKRRSSYGSRMSAVAIRYQGRGNDGRRQLAVTIGGNRSACATATEPPSTATLTVAAPHTFRKVNLLNTLMLDELTRRRSQPAHSVPRSLPRQHGPISCEPYARAIPSPRQGIGEIASPIVTP